MAAATQARGRKAGRRRARTSVPAAINPKRPHSAVAYPPRHAQKPDDEGQHLHRTGLPGHRPGQHVELLRLGQGYPEQVAELAERDDERRRRGAQIVDTALAVARERTRRIATSELNEVRLAAVDAARGRAKPRDLVYRFAGKPEDWSGALVAEVPALQVVAHGMNKLLEAKPKWLAMDYSVTEKLPAGDYSAVYYWNGAIMRSRLANPDIKFGYPKEGYPMFMDSVAILKDAKNVENAKLFMNFIMDPENAAMISAFAKYANGIKGSEQFMPADMKDAPELVIPAEFEAAGEFLQPLQGTDLGLDLRRRVVAQTAGAMDTRRIVAWVRSHLATSQAGAA